MPHFNVERSFASPFSDQDLDAVSTRMAPCLALYQVRWIRSHLSDDRLRMVCEYQARDAETLRKVQHEAGAQFDRVWADQVIVP